MTEAQGKRILAGWVFDVSVVLGVVSGALAVSQIGRWAFWVLCAIAIAPLLYLVLPGVVSRIHRERRSRSHILPSLLGMPVETPKYTDEAGLDVAGSRAVGLAALLLLLMDCLDSGMWGRGYLRRQRVDKKPDNAAGGTLTGTYFSICALSGYLGPHHLSGLYPLTDSLKQHIRTLLSTKDGTYLKNYEFTGTPRVEIPVSEAPRHTAAGLMLRLLFRDADERDEKTVRWLATRVLLQPENGDPVDIAFAARAVLAFHYEASTPGCLWGKDIHEAYTLGVQQLVSLSSEKDIRMVWAPRSGTHPGFDNSRFGAPIYQWTVVWALLPILQDTAFASREDQSAIESVIIRLTREQLSCRHDRNTLFAERWDPRQDRSGGESLFCTCVALASLSLLHARPSPTEEINRQVVELARVLSDFDTSRLCSVSKDSEEGYLAYAATLLASSTLSGQANARDLDDARAILTELQRERNESGDLLRSAHSTPRGSTTNLSDLEQTLRPEELRMVAELISQRETEFREHFPRKLMDEASS